MSVRTEPRFTRDADFAVAVASDTEAEALIRRLRAGGYEVTALVEQEAVGRLATVRLAVPGDAEGPVIDLLFASSGIEREVVAGSRTNRAYPRRDGESGSHRASGCAEDSLATTSVARGTWSIFARYFERPPRHKWPGHAMPSV